MDAPGGRFWHGARTRGELAPRQSFGQHKPKGLAKQIPVCLWFLARNKANGKFRNRRRQSLFIDARKLGFLVDRIHLELSDDEIRRIAGTYHAWRTVGADLRVRPRVGEGSALPREAKGLPYQDIPGFCKSAPTEGIAAHGYVLTPGRYVGAEAIEEDDEPFEEKRRSRGCLSGTSPLKPSRNC